MNLATWWLFVVMTFVVSATPGPNMLLVMVSGARFGFRAALPTMAGCLTALLGMISLSVMGLSAVLQAFPAVFDTLRLLGAAYLAYLGIQAWRTPVSATVTADAADTTALARQNTAGKRFRQGLMVASSNPKAILFAAAFFPQFISAGSPQLPQFAILLATFVVIETSWYLVYAGSGQRLSTYLQRPSVMRVFNRVTGSAFIGFAALMADVRR